MQQDVRVRTTAEIAGHQMLVPIPIACAIGAFRVADDSGNRVWRVSAAHPQLTQR
ncbi:hypothetical protein RAD15_32655 [Bradyrhizobium sp. 14AA]